MIDTIRFRTGSISEELVDIITTKMQVRHGLDMNTGEQMYCIISNTLAENTFNRSITIKLERERWERLYIPSAGELRTIKIECEPYLLIECSSNKILEGHNVSGGTVNVLKAVSTIIDRICDIYEIENSMFGDAMEFEVDRIDYAKNFRLSNVERYLVALGNAYYPRRKLRTYHDECVYFAGSTTTVKFYDKHKEYKNHDYKILKNGDLLEHSKNILRVEIEVKKRKLKEIFYSAKVKDIDMNKIIKLYDEEVEKIFKIRQVDSKKVMGTDVHDILLQKFGTKKADALYSSYNMLLSGGIMLLKKKKPKATYYRHIKCLKECGISWVDVKVNYSSETKEFVEFIPYSNSKYAVN